MPDVQQAAVEHEGLRAADGWASYHNRPLAGVTGKLAGALYLLAAARGGLVAYDELVRKVWDSAYAGSQERIYVAISELRKALEPTHLTISTTRGEGYRLVWWFDVEKPSAHRDRILLVEDDKAVVAALLRRTLFGFLVDVAYTSREAFKQFVPRADAVILLDVGLPDGNGLVFGEAAKRRDPEVKLIVMTDATDRRTIHWTNSRGALPPEAIRHEVGA